MSDPVCFMHVPKCAGSSMFASLEAALPEGALAPYRADRAAYGGFSDFDALRERVRATVAVEPEELDALGEYDAIFGHFDLSTLLRVTRAARVATVLREPRARLLSLYMYTRFTPGLDEELDPVPATHGSDLPFDEFLADRSGGLTCDNLLCRMLLRDDDRVPERDFIARADAEALAEAAIERLDTLGYVGILELGDEVWDGLSRMFGVAVAPVQANVSGELGYRPGSVPVPAFDATSALERLDERSCVDAIVYERLLARRLGDEREARRFADAAFAGQLVRYGAASGRGLGEAKRHIADQRSELVRLHETVAVLDTAAVDLHEQLAERHATVVRLHAEVAERDTTIAWLHDEVAQRDRTVVWLHGEVAERDAREARLHEALAASHGGSS